MEEVNAIIDKLRELCERSIADGEFSYDHNLELHKYCDSLSENPQFDTWAPLLFELIEEYAETVDLTLGSPGPLVHILEMDFKTSKYEEYLQDSLAKKPTIITVWMAERMSRSPDVDTDFWRQKIRAALSHPKASASLKNDMEDWEY